MDLVNRFRVKPGKKVKLSDWDPDDTAHVPGKESATEVTEENLQKLQEL